MKVSDLSAGIKRFDMLSSLEDEINENIQALSKRKDNLTRPKSEGYVSYTGTLVFDNRASRPYDKTPLSIALSDELFLKVVDELLAICHDELTQVILEKDELTVD